MKTALVRLTLAAIIALPSAAFASSEDAWDAMRKDVSAKCIKAAEGSIEKASAVVDPFGSERFGLALVRGKPKGAKGRITQICVYDKQAKTVELGSELTREMMKEAK